MIEVVACSGRGISPEQQDALAVGPGVVQSSNYWSHASVDVDELLIAVADGVASSPAAARASRLSLTYLHAVLLESPQWCVDGLVTGRHIRAVQQRLSARLARSRASYGASTTIVAAHLVGARVAVLNVGDSRAYLRRAASSDVRLISRDHTELASLRDEIGFRADMEYASIYEALSDCLIADPEEADFAINRQTVDLGIDDLLVLCSDGVHDVLGNVRWTELIAKVEDPVLLVKQARAEVIAAGATDNFSVVAARRFA
ncbi:MAG: protein phosphatase 2C domain-containing protein [Xanthomonadales bacterium]|nr:protein phosphatase 2C domain-containing protein [Xanthomonadales bacterium]